MKKLSTLLILAAGGLTLSASPLTPQQALAAATAGNGPSNAAGASYELAYSTRGIYVFNRPTGGFIVTSADTAGAPLLGYSNEGSFDADNIPSNMEWFLDSYTDQIAAAAAEGMEYSYEADSYGRTPIEPLIQNHWNQSGPYNDLCPEVNGVVCPTGCVATAMAQVMQYWQYPAQGTGSISYTWRNETLSYDFSGDTYDWDNMTYEYGEESTEAEKSAVARLMLACGMATKMNYGPSASGSNYYNAAAGMLKYFGYDRAMNCLDRDFFTADAWAEMIYAELEAGRPVLYSGANSRSGHAFVCDGYQGENYFHINWGWGGKSDGYFLLDALDPSSQGIGGSTSGYNSDQIAVLGIQPPVEGNELAPIMRSYGELNGSINSKGIAMTVKHTACGDETTKGVFSGSIEKIKATIGVRLTPVDGGQEVYAPCTSGAMNINTNCGLNSYTVYLSDLPTEGTYIVTSAFEYNGTWYNSLQHNNVPTRLMVTIENGTYTFEKVERSAMDDVKKDIRIGEPGTTTSIETIAAEAQNVDVYTITGRRVRTAVNAANATDGLTPGLYIIGGKKVAVK